MTITSYRLMLLSQRQVTCQALSPCGARFSRRRCGSPELAVLAWHHPDKRKEPENLEEGARCRDGSRNTCETCGGCRGSISRSLDKYIFFNNLQWWRRGESEQIVVLKTRNLLIFRDAQNANNSKNAANWNVSGTQPQAARTSRWSTCPISASYRTGVLLPDSADQALAESGS